MAMKTVCVKACASVLKQGEDTSRTEQDSQEGATCVYGHWKEFASYFTGILDPMR
jgi:hypothetical protein